MQVAGTCGVVDTEAELITAAMFFELRGHTKRKNSVTSPDCECWSPLILQLGSLCQALALSGGTLGPHALRRGVKIAAGPGPARAGISAVDRGRR